MPAICQLERYQIQQQVQQWVQRTSTSYLQQCETVSDQIDSWVQSWTNQCNSVAVQTCQNWPWPLNYLCKWVTQVVCALVQVAVEVVSTVTRVVLQLTVAIVAALISVVATVLVPIVAFVCALSTSNRVQMTGGSEPPSLGGANFGGDDDGRSKRKPFLWGVATAGQQVEGDGLASDWQFFVTQPDITARATNTARIGGEQVNYEPPGRGIDHSDLDVFHADVLRAKALGCNAYRLSIEWSRIQTARPDWVDTALQNNTVDLNVIYRFSDALSSAADMLMTTASDPTLFDIDAFGLYSQMIDIIRSEGLKAVVTLSHMALPLWVCKPPVESFYYITTPSGTIHSGDPNDPDYQASLRGWESPLTAAAYEAFVRFVVAQLNGKVLTWITVNEPVGSVVELGYIAGVWPPGLFADGNRALSAIHILIAAHVAAYNFIKSVSPDSMVGFSHAVGDAVAAPQTLFDKLFGDNVAARNQWYYAHVSYFLDAVVNGSYNPQIWRKTTPVIHNAWMGKLDFIAPQYYRRFDIQFSPAQALAVPFVGGVPITDVSAHPIAKTWSLYNDMGWPVDPAGLHDLLVDLHNTYKLPILVTENGMGESRDRNRAAYIVAHLQQILRAVQDGVPILGYFHWSIADNWEWAYDYLPKARFGLYTLDRTEDPEFTGTGSFQRHVTEGALALLYCIRNSQRVRAAKSSADPLDLPARSFGTYTPDGKSIIAPTFGQGSWWSGATALARGTQRERLVLHLGTLFDGSLFGLMYLPDKDLCFPLEDVVWTPDVDPIGAKEGAGTLQFQHQMDIGIHASIPYAFTLQRHTQGGHQDLSGTRLVSGVDWTVDLEWSPLDGTWAPSDPNDDIQAIMPREYGGEGLQLAPKYLRPTRGWQPRDLAEPVQDDGLSVDLGSLALVGEALMAQVSGPSSGATRQWNGVRLPDGIVF